MSVNRDHALLMPLMTQVWLHLGTRKSNKTNRIPAEIPD